MQVIIFSFEGAASVKYDENEIKNILKMMLKCLYVMMPLLLIWIYIWKNLFAYVDEEAHYYLWNKQKTHVMQDQYYDTIILGDSVVNAAYILEILSDLTVNR